MFGLDWTFRPKKASKRSLNLAVVTTRTKATKRRNVMKRNEVNCEEGRRDTTTPVGDFNRAIAPVLFVSQMFGAFPVHGIFSSNVNDLKFKWKSFRTLHNLGMILLVFVVIISDVISYITSSKATYKFEIDYIILAPATIAIAIASLYLARKWPALMRKWYDVEVAMAKYQFKNASKDLIRTGRTMAVLSVGYILLKVTSFIWRDVKDAYRCYDSSERLNGFLRMSTAYIEYFWNSTSYPAVAVAIVGRSWRLYMIVYINFIIIMLCIGLVSQFKMLNENLLAAKCMNMPLSYWTVVRADYGRLVDLCKSVDDEICFVFMITLLYEIYYIASRFFIYFKYVIFTWNEFHPWAFLAINFTVCFAKMFLAAKINDESKRPFKVLRSVPSESWNLEAQRFAEEVSTNTIALSGMKFFLITRRGILRVFGAIVTYEIIISQFDIDATFTECQKKTLRN